MKKERIVYLSVIALLIALLIAAATALTVTAVKLNKYDINEDGQTNVKDITSLLDYLADGREHIPVTVEWRVPTCTETGLTEGSICSVCKEMLTAQTVIPAPGRLFVLCEILNAVAKVNYDLLLKRNAGCGIVCTEDRKVNLHTFKALPGPSLRI